MANKKYSLHYYDNHSILLVNSSGIIRQLFTPFKVRCDVDVGRHTAGSYVYVDEVVPGDKDELIYHIGDGAYYHKHFRIVANF